MQKQRRRQGVIVIQAPIVGGAESAASRGNRGRKPLGAVQALRVLRAARIGQERARKFPLGTQLVIDLHGLIGGDAVVREGRYQIQSRGGGGRLGNQGLHGQRDLV